MFKIDHNRPNRIDIEFSGKLDKAQMKTALDEFVSQTKNIEHGRMLYRIDDFKLPTLGAIALELSRLPELLRAVRKFDRAAVLADKAWVKTASEIESYPEQDVRHLAELKAILDEEGSTYAQ